MPVGIVAIVLFAITAGIGAFIAVTRIIVKHLETRRSLPGGASLTQSELRDLVASAVADAVAPIQDELATLRRSLAAQDESRLLSEHQDPDKQNR